MSKADYVSQKRHVQNMTSLRQVYQKTLMQDAGEALVAAKRVSKIMLTPTVRNYLEPSLLNGSVGSHSSQSYGSSVRSPSSRLSSVDQKPVRYKSKNLSIANTSKDLSRSVSLYEETLRFYNDAMLSLEVEKYHIDGLIKRIDSIQSIRSIIRREKSPPSSSWRDMDFKSKN